MALEHPKHNEQANSLRATTETSRDELISKIDKSRKDVHSFLKQYDQLKTNYPEIFEKVARDNPTLTKDVEKVIDLAKQMEASSNQYSSSELLDLAEEFNFIAQRINKVSSRLSKPSEGGKEGFSAIESINADALEQELTPEQKKQIKAFANELYNELFPKSYVHSFVEALTPGSELEDYQRILIAPAEGIEGAIKGVIDLANPQTYKDLQEAVSTLSGMEYEEWCAAGQMIKMMYEESSTTDKAAPAIAFISGCAFLFGGVSKLKTLSKGTKVPAALIPTLNGVASTSRGIQNLNYAQALPAAVIGGLTLNYI